MVSPKHSETLGAVTLSIISFIRKQYWNKIQERKREGEKGTERVLETEEDNVPQSSDKLNVTRWLLSPSAVTVNFGLGKMSKMFSRAWAELITEPKATQTRAANGPDLQIKLH